MGHEPHAGATPAARCACSRRSTSTRRRSHVLRPGWRIGAADVIELVKAAIAEHGALEFIRSDNGSEFIAHDLQRWLADQHIKTIYITPASPWENGVVESFPSRFRDEC